MYYIQHCNTKTCYILIQWYMNASSHSIIEGLYLKLTLQFDISSISEHPNKHRWTTRTFHAALANWCETHIHHVQGEGMQGSSPITVTLPGTLYIQLVSGTISYQDGPTRSLKGHVSTLAEYGYISGFIQTIQLFRWLNLNVWIALYGELEFGYDV